MPTHKITKEQCEAGISEGCDPEVLRIARRLIQGGMVFPSVLDDPPEIGSPEHAYYIAEQTRGAVDLVQRVLRAAAETRGHDVELDREGTAEGLRTERVEIEVGTAGLRYPCSASGEPAAWRQYGELRARGAEAYIRRRVVVEYVSPWQDMTRTEVEDAHD